MTRGRIVTLQSAITLCALMKMHPRNMKGLGPRPPPTTNTILIAFTMPPHPHRAPGGDNICNGRDCGARSSLARPVRECPCWGDGPQSLPTVTSAPESLLDPRPPLGQGWSGSNPHKSLSKYLVCVDMGKRHGRSSGMRHGWRSSSSGVRTPVRVSVQGPPGEVPATAPFSSPLHHRYRRWIGGVSRPRTFSYQSLSTSATQKRSARHSTPAAVPSVTGTAVRRNRISSSYSSSPLLRIRTRIFKAAAGCTAAAARCRKTAWATGPIHCTSGPTAVAYTKHTKAGPSTQNTQRLGLRPPSTTHKSLFAFSLLPPPQSPSSHA